MSENTEFSPPTLEIRDRALDPAVIQACRAWPVVVDLDPAPHAPFLAGVYLRCARCTQGVARLSAGDPAPGTTVPLPHAVQELEAGVLRHVLQAHRLEVDPEWSGT